MENETLDPVQEQLLADKRRFASFLIKNPKDPYEAGRKTFPNNVGMGFMAAQKWVEDAYVLAHLDTAIESARGETYLPTKEEVAREFWAIATSKTAKDADRVRALEKYAELMAYAESEKAAANKAASNSNTTLRVEFVSAGNGPVIPKITPPLES